MRYRDAPVTTPYASEAFLHQILAKAQAAQASDIHLRVGQPPGARVHGDIVYFRAEPLLPEDTEAVARLVLARRPSVLGALGSLREVDVSYEIEGLGRFRVHVYLQRGTISLVMRVIPGKTLAFEALGVPPAARGLADKSRGLVLVVGAAGQGKTTTLASMLAHIVETYPKHLVTIEDPIEFVHASGRATVSQREVGSDTESFASGVRAALRQDPNVLLVGEIRDAATMEVVLQAAETGHLVLSSLHTPDVGRTVGRLLSMSSTPQETRDRLSECLQGIVAQRLLPRREGGGLVLASEVLVATGTVRAAIKHPEGNPSLRELMEKGVTPYGMQTFAMHIERLVAEGLVDADVARAATQF
ncbi:PilT/PilU family type 4a pilus ATPase [Polyangium sp. 15x6]|uniref:type IV pilus twitching motility protein PilT n=1 Tax=Polyangium sp. 15x6 TaxID=3042687 RepID=UPI00249C1595|nr:PilT/PilU family type 4a pilus ATPase [Polyangium sp. 15x6]MDI3286283.1 PilT/PilU family type 4a pilus ATPase [Polyangium sp. 15x6]